MNFQALRSLLALLRWLAIGLVAADLVLLGLRLWPGLLSPLQLLGGRLVSALVSIVLLAVVLLLVRRVEQLLQSAEDDARRQREVLDALQAGIVLFGRDGRIELTNNFVDDNYRALGAASRPGASYEQLLRAAVAAGLVPEAAGREDDWVTKRVASFGHANPGPLRRLPDGRTLRITELTLADGRRLAHLVDVSELVAKEQALEAARREADAARAEADRLRRQLRDAIEALPVGFELYGADERLDLVNQAAIEMYPQLADLASQRPTFEQVVRTNVARGGLPMLKTPEEVEDWIARRVEERRSPGPPRTHQLDDQRWVRTYERRLSGGGIVAVRLDISEIERQRRETEATRADAELARQRLRDAIEVLPASFDLFDAEDRLVLFNRMTAQFFPRIDLKAGMTWEQLVRANAAGGGLPHLDTPAKLDAWIEQRRRDRAAPGEPRLIELDRDLWVRVYERHTSDGGLVSIRLDVSELVRREAELSLANEKLSELNAELAELSITDSLTGLANRRAFDARLVDEVSRAVRHGTPLALLIVDVDHFKRYNDRYGHAAGDDCLKAVAAVLRASAGRPTDLVARVGGEEFALLLPHEAGRGALALAQRCLRALDAEAIPHADSPVAPQVTVSIGVADLWGCGMRDPAALFAAADAALYAAKGQGRHRAVVFAAE